MNSVIRRVKLDQIRINGGTQPRIEVNDAVVADYAEALTSGDKLPPVTIFYDGASYWLADGFHRYFAHKKIGALDIDVDAHQGTKRDAILYSVGANAAHGLRRSNADKRKAVGTLLGDAEWTKLSDREIAKRCGVSNDFVSRIRKESLSLNDSESVAERTYTTKHGTEAVMNTANIGKKPAAGKTEESPPTPAPGPAPGPKSAEVQSTTPETAQPGADHEDDLDDFDPLAELEVAQKTIDQLNARIKALSADDVGRELEKEIHTRQGVEARLAQEMDRANRLDRELRGYGKWVADLRKLLRIDGGRAQITETIKTLIREVA